MRYARPATLSEAVTLRAEGIRILAGATDIYPATAGAALAEDVLDLTAIPDLTAIRLTDDGLRIGACATWSDISAASLPPALAVLQQAAAQVGGRQIQNAGTIGGNICNASPAADGIAALLVLDARVDLLGPAGGRQLALSAFVTAPRRTALLPQEIVTAIVIPTSALVGRSAFVKLGARAHLVISIAMAAARVVLRDGRIAMAALSVGACSPVARRLFALETELVGLTPEQAAERITPAALAPHLSPIDDIRATAAYRLDAAAELLRRALAGAT